MRFLPPQRLRPHYYESVETDLREAFAAFVFRPLQEILSTATTQAAGLFASSAPVPSKPLLLALRSGSIQYVGGVVSGEFDAKTTAALRGIGAELDLRSGVFRLPEWTAPGWFKAEAAAAQARAESVHKALTRELDRMQERLDAAQVMAPVIDPHEPIEAIEDGFETAAGALGISKRITITQRAAMENRYQDDIMPYVTEATREYIKGVHAAVTDNAARGYRYETIVADLEHFVGVSERKARFLARQETAVFMAEYRRERFTAAGVTRYKWSTSHDIRVRPYADNEKRKKYGDHRELDQQIFFYSLKAPAQFMSSKKPCNPGEDFQCRCMDLAVLE